MGLPVKTRLRWLSVLGISLCIELTSVQVAQAASLGDCVRSELATHLGKAEVRFDREKLASEIAARRARVPEFEFIRNEAEKRGLRVWLFGGTAAGYGHYVKWDLLREAGDLRFQKARFDYDYTNIYRSTQDLDIVVDGSASQAQEFQQVLKTQFPYFVGSKATPWEVRSLREASHDKGAILDDFGFMNQHTDSNSTGMIELTNPPQHESVVRDIRDWKNANDSQFLKDVHEDKLTYYFSPTHEQTARAKEGKNPPIFSVVRALTKAFQYDLKLRPEDLAVMKKEIDQFSPYRDLRSADAQRWLEKNGKKLYQHAVDIEYASETLNQLGLKQKLLAIKNNPNDQDSLSWWMSKEPLKAKPVGEGSGTTAKELGLDVVAHETNNFLAYESITRAHTGEPNVLISRQGAAGETAVYGNGFYTKTGIKGARGTGITIRFKVDPNAREGKDFTRSGEFIIWQNKNAIRVIPESLEMSPSQYFEFLAEGKEISEADKALLWKLKRKLEHSMASGLADPAELKKIRILFMEQMKAKAPNHGLVFYEWIKLEGARLGMSAKEIEILTDSLRTKIHRADPAPTFDGLNRLSHGTEVEEWMSHEAIPTLLKELKPDIGEQAIENSLSSSHPEMRKFGLRALDYAEKEHPFDRIQMLRKLVEERPNQPIDRHAAQAWLRSDLEKNSSLPVFEKFAKNDAARLALLRATRAESFQFHAFRMPPGGKKVTLGSPAAEAGRSKNEPIREVLLTHPFEMQATPVTQAQWTLVMGENPSNFKQGGEVVGGIPMNPNRPVEKVSWEDVQKFIEKLNKLDDHSTYRLPTEAEWEVAARAETSTAYSFGDNSSDLSEYGWHSGNSGNQTHDVASLKPNPAGLYDVHGNVWEWVQDWYEEAPQGGTDVKDPTGPPRGLDRVIRGGGWATAHLRLRSAQRFRLPPGGFDSAFGFRLVRTPRIP